MAKCGGEKICFCGWTDPLKAKTWTHYINSTGFYFCTNLSLSIGLVAVPNVPLYLTQDLPIWTANDKNRWVHFLLDGGDVRKTPDKLFSGLMPVFQWTSLSFISCFSNRWCTAASLNILPQHTWLTHGNQRVLIWHFLVSHHTHTAGSSRVVPREEAELSCAKRTWEI